MILHKALAAVAVAVTSVAAAAGPVVIDFEGTQSFGSINGYYNGGVDGAGNSGPNYGVAFAPGAQGLSNDAVNTYFSHAPSAGSVMFATDADAFMNIASGFFGIASFYYSSSVAALNAINIYSGLNGTGAILGSFSLAANSQLGCIDTAFCNFDKISVSFAGIGKSVGFGVSPGSVAFDNIEVSAVPEPSSYALTTIGLAALGLFARRRKA